MALGVYAAVCQWKKAGGTTSSEFPIAGFNNTREFRSVMAADPHNLLVASVDQDLNEYTRRTFSAMESLLAGETVESHILITPVLPE